MADTIDTSKIDRGQKDPTNNSNETQKLESNAAIDDVENVNDVETSGTGTFERNDDPMKSISPDKSKKTAGANISPDLNSQEETTVLKTSSGLPESNETNNVDESSNHGKLQGETNVDIVPSDKQTEKPVETHPPINVKNVEGNDVMNTTSGHKEHEEMKKSNASSNSSEDERTDHSAPYHRHNEHKRKNNENTSSKDNDPNKQTDPKNASDVGQSGGSTTSNISYSDDEPDLLEPILNNATNKKLINHLLGCAYGQALGDAYGLSTEFEDRVRIMKNYPNKEILIPFPKYVRTGHNRRWAEGDWTDDTDQWILILETLVYHDGAAKVFAEKLTNWIRHGYPDLGDHGGMGLGANVSQVVHSHNYIDEPLKASKMVWERSNRQAAPNGAVMRCSASAFVHFNDLEKVKLTAELMCKTTHFDPRCIASCLAVCLTITYLLREEFIENDIEVLIKRVQEETIKILGDHLSKEYCDSFLWHTDKERTLEELELDEPRSIGYTYKCLASGFYGLRSTGSFEETLNDLIRYGGDADTNGAVCGTMYGARYGYEALPFKWLRAMPNKKWLDNKLIKCLAKMNVNPNEAMDTSQ